MKTHSFFFRFYNVPTESIESFIELLKERVPTIKTVKQYRPKSSVNIIIPDNSVQVDITYTGAVYDFDSDNVIREEYIKTMSPTGVKAENWVRISPGDKTFAQGAQG